MEKRNLISPNPPGITNLLNKLLTVSTNYNVKVSAGYFLKGSALA